jgi:hypothetical protein
MSEADILLHDKLTTLEHAHPHALCVVHTLGNPSPGWTGTAGYVSHKLVSAHVLPAEHGNKIKYLYVVHHILPHASLFALCG